MNIRLVKGLIFSGILASVAAITLEGVAQAEPAAPVQSLEEEVGAVAPAIEPTKALDGSALEANQTPTVVGSTTAIALMQPGQTAEGVEPMAAIAPPQEEAVGTPALQLANASVPQEPGRVSDLKPSTLAKSAKALTAAPTSQSTSENPGESKSPADPLEVSQAVDLGGPTQGGASYLGIAANIGFSGNSSDLGRTSFTVISKLGLTNYLSFRPTVMFNQTATILLPITFDFPVRGVEAADVGFRISPFVGGGAAINTGSDTRIGGLITAGVDVPINRQFTAVASVNVGFLNNTDVGLVLGIAYNFDFLR